MENVRFEARKRSNLTQVGGAEHKVGGAALPGTNCIGNSVRGLLPFLSRPVSYDVISVRALGQGLGRAASYRSPPELSPEFPTELSPWLFSGHIQSCLRGMSPELSA